MKKKWLIFSVALALIAGLVMFGCDNDPPDNKKPANKVIDLFTIPGVTPPAYTETPVTFIGENDQYTGTVSWEGEMENGKFGSETEYKATITLTAKTGFTLTGIPAGVFTVAGATSTTHAANSGLVTAVFPPTGDIAPVAVSIKAIPGVTIPAPGGIPVSTITATDQFTGTVIWLPNDNPFKSGETYTATINLTAKPGFTFNGITADFFTVAGATATNLVNSGVVTAEFPVTANAPISIKAIPGLVVETGGTPASAITATDQFTGTVTWLPNDNPFKPSEVYTATITLTAKPGFTFDGVEENFFTVAGAETVTNDANSGVVTAVFFETTANLPDPVTIQAIPGVAIPSADGVPVSVITATDEFTGTVTWSPNENPFRGGEVYTATITLTAKSGFTFNSVDANFFSVAGATTVSNAANSGVVTAVFPAAVSITDIVDFGNLGTPEKGLEISLSRYNGDPVAVLPPRTTEPINAISASQPAMSRVLATFDIPLDLDTGANGEEVIWFDMEWAGFGSTYSFATASSLPEGYNGTDFVLSKVTFYLDLVCELGRRTRLVADGDTDLSNPNVKLPVKFLIDNVQTGSGLSTWAQNSKAISSITLSIVYMQFSNHPQRNAWGDIIAERNPVIEDTYIKSMTVTMLAPSLPVVLYDGSKPDGQKWHNLITNPRYTAIPLNGTPPPTSGTTDATNGIDPITNSQGADRQSFIIWDAIDMEVLCGANWQDYMFLVIEGTVTGAGWSVIPSTVYQPASGGALVTSGINSWSGILRDGNIFKFELYGQNAGGFNPRGMAGLRFSMNNNATLTVTKLSLE